jgi:hypothetical protein
VSESDLQLTDQQLAFEAVARARQMLEGRCNQGLGLNAVIELELAGIALSEVLSAEIRAEATRILLASRQ